MEPTRSSQASLGLVLLSLMTLAALIGCSGQKQAEVVVYAAQDQVYAEPILQEFARQTGIRVRPLFDSEAVKTVGLANRLLAEMNHPQADVFWGNEELRTRHLAAKGVFRSTNGLATFGYRTRRLVINTNRLSLAQAPRTWVELTNAAWRGKVALAYPLFGTTATHFLALRQHWGIQAWETWCRALQANQPFLVDGNSVVVQFVHRGDAWIGLTDSDDIAAGQRQGWPIVALPLMPETLFIPNTVAVIRQAPHPNEAEQLFRYLQRPEIAQRLLAGGALEGLQPVTGTGLTVRWDALLEELDGATASLRGIFLK